MAGTKKYQAEWRKRNPERVREYNRRYREKLKAQDRSRHHERIAREGREAHNAKKRAYWAKTADQINARRRARRRNRPDELYVKRTPEERAYLDALRRDPCAYCGGKADTFDHIEPTEDSDWDNLTAACGACNTSKSNRSLLFALCEWNGYWRFIPGLRA